MKLPDDVWQVIQNYLAKHHFDIPHNLREKIEKGTDVYLFDGGALISIGNQFDLFVSPDKRGRWRIREVARDYFNKMFRNHDKLVVRIYDDNISSIRLARYFGFKEVSRSDGFIRLEKHKE